MSPFQIKTGANQPQTTPRKLGLLTSPALVLFGSLWDTALAAIFFRSLTSRHANHRRPVLAAHRLPRRLVGGLGRGPAHALVGRAAALPAGARSTGRRRRRSGRRPCPSWRRSSSRWSCRG